MVTRFWLVNTAVGPSSARKRALTAAAAESADRRSWTSWCGRGRRPTSKHASRWPSNRCLAVAISNQSPR
jgi:hypothetical protein